MDFNNFNSEWWEKLCSLGSEWFIKEIHFLLFTHPFILFQQIKINSKVWTLLRNSHKRFRKWNSRVLLSLFRKRRGRTQSRRKTRGKRRGKCPKEREKEKRKQTQTWEKVRTCWRQKRSGPQNVQHDRHEGLIDSWLLESKHEMTQHPES